MDMSAGQSTFRQTLPMGWIRKLFGELQGNYGTRFLDMWRSGQADTNGDDVGLQNAMDMWAEKLAGFRERPDAIRRVEMFFSQRGFFQTLQIRAVYSFLNIF